MEMDKRIKSLILPLFDTVLFPGVKTKITVGKTVRRALEANKDITSVPVIALTVREKDEQGRLGVSQFLSGGNGI